jgi:hypothetical protein
MGRSDFFRPGSWNNVCQQCGLVFKAEDISLEWDGLRVCPKCLDYRHPQELVRPVVDPTPPRWTSPQVDNFLTNLGGGDAYRVLDSYQIDSTTLG